MAETFDHVEEAELCTGVRALALHDDARPAGPTIEAKHPGHLCHPGTVVPLAVVGIDCLPLLGGEFQAGVTDVLGDAEISPLVRVLRYQGEWQG